MNVIFPHNLHEFQKNNKFDAKKQDTPVSIFDEPQVEKHSYDEDVVNAINNPGERTKGIRTAFINFFATDKRHSEQDGQIEPTKQGQVGDCWILSGVNSLSYSEKGREIIENSLQYTEEGVYVNFKGIDKSYYVSNENISLSTFLSRGDKDMRAFELATNYALQDYASGKIEINDETSKYVKYEPSLNTSEDGLVPIHGDFTPKMMYLLTGQNAGYLSSDPKNGNQALDDYIANDGKSMSITLSPNFEKDEKSKTFTTLDNKEVEMSNNHAYAVKAASGNSVTVIDPWDSSKEIKLDRDTVIDNFYFSAIDLNEDNTVEPVKINSNSETVSINGKEYTQVSYSDVSNNELVSKITYIQGSNYALQEYPEGKTYLCEIDEKLTVKERVELNNADSQYVLSGNYLDAMANGDNFKLGIVALEIESHYVIDKAA